MTHELALRDHRALQHAVLRTTLAGAGVGLLHGLFPSAITDALALLAVGVAAVPPRNLRSLATAGSLACIAAGVAHLGGWTGLSGFAAVSALMFARDLGSWPRRVLAAAGGLVALAAGGFLVEAMRAGEVLVGVSPSLEWLLLGGGAGFLAGFGVTGREVDRVPVLEAAEEKAALGCGAAEAGGAPSSALVATRTPNAGRPIGDSVDGALDSDPRSPSVGRSDVQALVKIDDVPADSEIAELVQRAGSASREAREALGSDSAGASQAAAGLAERIDRFARRWHTIEREVGRTDRTALAARIAVLGERAHNASDEVVRTEYLRAERALRQQLDDLDGIRRCHDRAVARLHHHVAVLERLRLAALHRRSAEVGGAGDDLHPLVEEIAAATIELDTSAEVLELPS